MLVAASSSASVSNAGRPEAATASRVAANGSTTPATSTSSELPSALMCVRPMRPAPITPMRNVTLSPYSLLSGLLLVGTQRGVGHPAGPGPAVLKLGDQGGQLAGVLLDPAEPHRDHPVGQLGLGLTLVDQGPALLVGERERVERADDPAAQVLLGARDPDGAAAEVRTALRVGRGRGDGQVSVAVSAGRGDVGRRAARRRRAPGDLPAQVRQVRELRAVD